IPSVGHRIDNDVDAERIGAFLGKLPKKILILLFAFPAIAVVGVVTGDDRIRPSWSIDRHRDGGSQILTRTCPIQFTVLWGLQPFLLPVPHFFSDEPVPPPWLASWPGFSRSTSKGY